MHAEGTAALVIRPEGLVPVTVTLLPTGSIRVDPLTTPEDSQERVPFAGFPATLDGAPVLLVAYDKPLPWEDARLLCAPVETLFAEPRFPPPLCFPLWSTGAPVCVLHSGHHAGGFLYGLSVPGAPPACPLRAEDLARLVFHDYSTPAGAVAITRASAAALAEHEHVAELGEVARGTAGAADVDGVQGDGARTQRAHGQADDDDDVREAEEEEEEDEEPGMDEADVGTGSATRAPHGCEEEDCEELEDDDDEEEEENEEEDEDGRGGDTASATTGCVRVAVDVDGDEEPGSYKEDGDSDLDNFSVSNDGEEEVGIGRDVDGADEEMLSDHGVGADSDAASVEADADE